MMHIAVDLDGVLLDFVGGICESLRKEYGATLQPADIVEYELAPVLDPIIGRSWWDWMRERDWLWSLFPAEDGAIGAMDTLRRDGHYLEVVTAKPIWAEYAVWRWMGKWRPPVHRVTIVDVGESKLDITRAELLIDDSPRECKEFAGGHRTAILFDQPYNRNETSQTLGAYVYRAHGWADAVDLIREWEAS